MCSPVMRRRCDFLLSQAGGGSQIFPIFERKSVYVMVPQDIQAVLRQLSAMVGEWTSSGTVPPIERDMALEKLRRLYEELLFVPEETTAVSSEPVPNSAEPLDAESGPVSINLDEVLSVALSASEDEAEEPLRPASGLSTEVPDGTEPLLSAEAESFPEPLFEPDTANPQPSSQVPAFSSEPDTVKVPDTDPIRESLPQPSGSLSGLSAECGTEPRLYPETLADDPVFVSGDSEIPAPLEDAFQRSGERDGMPHSESGLKSPSEPEAREHSESDSVPSSEIGTLIREAAKSPVSPVANSFAASVSSLTESESWKDADAKSDGWPESLASRDAEQPKALHAEPVAASAPALAESESRNAAIAKSNAEPESPAPAKSEPASQPVIPTLFGPDETEALRRHRHKQRILMSLYDTPEPENRREPRAETRSSRTETAGIAAAFFPETDERPLPASESASTTEAVSAEDEMTVEEFEIVPETAETKSVSSDAALADAHTEISDPAGVQADGMQAAGRNVATNPAVEPAAGSAVLGEVMNHDRRTLADEFGGSVRSVASEIVRREPVVDLRRAIGINDKFLLIRDLFGGDAEAYEAALATLDTFDNLDDCLIHIAENYTWNPNSDGAKLVMELIERKLS